MPVPVHYGTRGKPTPDTLRVDLWLPRLDPTGNISSNLIDNTAGNITVSEFPFGSGNLLPYPFMIFFLPQRAVFTGEANRNKAVGRYAGLAVRAYYGNILVMKLGKRKPVVSIDKEDFRLVDAIVLK